MLTNTHEEYIHNFADLAWEMDDEPPPPTNSTPTTQLYHLLTITGQLIVAPYPATHTLGEHYVAWAPMSSEPFVLH